MSDLALLTFDGPVATLAFNRPDTANALSIDLLDAAAARVRELEARYAAGDGPTVVVLTGTGRAFCAGMDLAQVIVEKPGDDATPRALLTGLADFTIALRRLPGVVVAKVNGPAIGGGCGLTCVADVSITHAANKVGFPEVDMGICPAVVAPWLVRKIGPGPARRVLLSGGLMSGREAHEAGLIDHCVDTPEQLDAAMSEMVSRLATGGPLALAATKRLLNDLDGSMDVQLVRRGAELSAQVLCTEPAQAALRARRKK
ncbi:MAG: enoyl-CoA hydratase/isomerase family protein [Phycisphaerales bacterium]|nr:enoyl-CoA hydratase/isomerase family protein [Phycisphaerales bacterium]MCB9841126.1 enoyl-CoA hydratase/isomerase family protein [Phycisphaeraceae bacterium]